VLTNQGYSSQDPEFGLENQSHRSRRNRYFVREEADGCAASINCWCFGSEVVAWRGVVGSLVSFSREHVDDSFTTRLSLLLPLYSSFSGHECWEV
jgi:hypothetical protein